MSIEDKLKEILKQNAGFDNGFEMSGDAGWGGNLNKATLEVMIPQIIQAFKDEGWQKPNEFGQISYTTYYKAGKTTLVPAQPDIMTGQEWYDRLIKEVDHEKIEWPTNSSNEYIVATIGNVYLTAAKKAAGL